MLPQFELIVPKHLDSHSILLGRFDDPYFKSRKEEHFFVKKHQHLIICSHNYFTNLRTKITKLLRDQIEIPLPAVRWIIDTIEIKFFKPPSQGGLPAAQFQQQFSFFDLFLFQHGLMDFLKQVAEKHERGEL